MTIFVTWQLIVTLDTDSIRNSCEVSLNMPAFSLYFIKRGVRDFGDFPVLGSACFILCQACDWQEIRETIMPPPLASPNLSLIHSSFPPVDGGYDKNLHCSLHQKLRLVLRSRRTWFNICHRKRVTSKKRRNTKFYLQSICGSPWYLDLWFVEWTSSSVPQPHLGTGRWTNAMPCFLLLDFIRIFLLSTFVAFPGKK